MSLVQQSGLVNSQNSHFSNPGFSSRVGAVSGCGGSVTSADALNQTGMYEVMKIGGAKKCPKSCKCTCHNCYCRGKCSGKCGCPCHKTCAGNCGCKCHKCMSCGKIHRKGGGKKCPMSGGNGYGFSKNQSLASTSGVNSVNGSVHLAGFTGYQNKGIDSDTNMGASSQSGGSGYGFGSGGTPYYSYNPSKGENLSPFAGSGYPPITRQLNNQCITPPILVQEGGKTRKTRNGRKLRKSRKGKKSRKSSMRKRYKKGKKSRRRQKGGSGQYMSNIANSHIYSTGAPPSLTPNESMLASPPPFTPKNDCMNSWKHLGDTPPYNEVYM